MELSKEMGNRIKVLGGVPMSRRSYATGIHGDRHHVGSC
jgi:hypothetical protein